MKLADYYDVVFHIPCFVWPLLKKSFVVWFDDANNDLCHRKKSNHETQTKE